MAQTGHITMQEAGVIPPPAGVPLHLLPLCQPLQPAKAPLHRLPYGHPSPPRVAFETSASGTSSSSSSSSSSSKISWTSTRHVFPSAYPRSHYHGTAPPGPSQPEPRTEQMTAEQAKESLQHDLELAEELLGMSPIESYYPPNDEGEARRSAQVLVDSAQPQLWNCVARIVPLLSSGRRRDASGITLFMAHSNGLAKEMWEPTLQNLVPILEREGIIVREIWTLDTFDSGDAGVMNRGNLSVGMSWFDPARDIQQFVEHYLPCDRVEDALPTELERLPERCEGRRTRRLIGFGDSQSGCCLTMINALKPDLFDGIAVIEPIFVPTQFFMHFPVPKHVEMARAAFYRPDVFASRRAVEEYLRKKPFFAVWDERIRQLYARFGFSPLPLPPAGTAHGPGELPVTLNKTKWSEGFMFANTFTASWVDQEFARQTQREIRPTDKHQRFFHCLFTDYYTKPESPLHLTYLRLKELMASAKSPEYFTSTDVQGNHTLIFESPPTAAKALAEGILPHLKRQGQSARQDMHDSEQKGRL